MKRSTHRIARRRVADAPGGVNPHDRGGAGRHVVPGLHAARAFLERRPGAVRRVLAARELPAAIEQLARACGAPIERVEGEALDRLVGGVQHQGVVVLGAPPASLPLADLDPARHPIVLALDELTDPRNVGAILRTAEAAGAAGVLLTRDRMPGLPPALVKSAAGAVEWLPLVRVTNLARALEALRDRGYWIVGLDGAAERSVHDPDGFPGLPCVLVAGAEGSGLRHLTREYCHRLLRIPMVGRVESLNASVAAAVGLYELRRLADASGN